MRTATWRFACLSLFWLSFAFTTDAQYGRAPSAKLLRNGKIFDLENMVQIPLTAAGNYYVGNVKTVAYKEYHFSGRIGKQEKVISDTGLNVYDRSGHLVDQYNYTPNHDYDIKCTYKYDDNNRAIEWVLKVSGNLATDATITFRYDNKGNKVEEISTDKNPGKSSRKTFKYDSEGRETEEADYDADGKLSMISSYSYDSKGRQTEYAKRGPGGSLFVKYTCMYNTSGDKIAGTHNSSDTGRPYRWIRKCDGKGKCLEELNFNPDGSMETRTTYKYDEHDNVTEQVSYATDGTVDEKSYNVFREFEYDKTGNIIKYTQYNIKEGKRIPVGVTETAFTYY